MDYIRKTADIFISDELREVLVTIQEQSIVAKMLLRKRHPISSLVDDFVNYISVSNTDKTKMSYLTKERQAKVTDFWDSKSRYMTKPGAFVRKIFRDINDVDVEKFSALYKNIQTKNEYNFKVVKGDDILNYYNGRSYASDSSSLGNSCMKYSKCQNWLKIYSENPDVVSMLVLLDDNDRLIGRALLWNISPKVMDRIYTINDEKYALFFKRWADENGYSYKKEQRWNNSLEFESNGKSSILNLSVKLDFIDENNYPYLDTFKFLSVENKTLYNYIPEGIDIITLCSADGDWKESNYLVMDVKSNLFWYREDCKYVDYLKGYVYEDDVCWSDLNDTYIHRDDVFYHEGIDDYLFKNLEMNCDVVKSRLSKEDLEMA